MHPGVAQLETIDDIFEDEDGREASGSEVDAELSEAEVHQLQLLEAELSRKAQGAGALAPRAPARKCSAYERGRAFACGRSGVGRGLPV